MRDDREPLTLKRLLRCSGQTLGIVLALMMVPIAKSAASDVVTQRYNVERTGSTTQRGFNQSDVADPNWRELGRLMVNGIVFAQPLYVENLPGAGSRKVRNVVYVATGSNGLYAFDADTRALIWDAAGLSQRMGQNDKSAIGKLGCDNISLPNGIGIEATPVIDRTRGVIYVSYRTNPSSTDLAQARQHLRAVDIRDGHVLQDVEVTPPDAPRDWTIWHRNRAALLLDKGVVYIGFGSRCEDPGTPVFHGWILGYDARSLKRVAAYSPTFDPAKKPIDGGGIWQGAGGLAADAYGNIYATTGNRRGGLDDLPWEIPNLADSLIKLAPRQARGQWGELAYVELQVADYFTPYRKVWLDDQDLDLAAAGPVVIPHSHYVLGGGKSGMVYILDQDNLGKFDQAKAWNTGTLNKLPLDMVESESPEDFSADHVVQKFQAAFNQYVPPGSPNLPRAGAPLVAAKQNANQTDLFAVGRDGALAVYWQAGAGPWTDGTSGNRGPASITPPGLAPVSLPTAPPVDAHIAVAKQADNQLDAFVVGQDGAVRVTWEVADGHWADGTPGQPGPVPVTPPGFAPPGAPLAVANQGAGQLDAFVTGNDGAVHVSWVVGGGHWADGSPGNPGPASVTPPGLAPQGASVAAAPQGKDQLDAFVTGHDGAIHVSWVSGVGRWTDGLAGNPGPIRITPPGLLPAGAAVAAAEQTPDQLDAFAVGNDGAIYVTWVVGGGHWADGSPGNPGPARITPAGLAPPGACVTAVHQNDQQLDVFVVGKDGAIYVTWVVGGGHWADGTPGNPAPARIALQGMSTPGSCIAAIKPTANEMDAFFVGRDGSIWRSWEENDGRWRDGAPTFEPARLTQAVWMRGCWPCWPHIHGAPVFAAFTDSRAMIYVWPEKDHLKAFRWLGDKADVGHPVLATDKTGQLVRAPPGPPFGMPGGMLAVSVDSTRPGSGVLFASIPRPEGIQMQGMLRAFDPFTLREIWNNDGADYMFAKFVPPTLAGRKVFLPTASNAVIVYGLR
jgi:hypothetical protein